MADVKRKAPNATAGLTAAAHARYAEALKGYLARRVRHPEDAADMSQEIFELFIRRHQRPEAVHNPLAYLFRIAFHVVCDANSRRKRDPVKCDSQLLELQASGESSSSESNDQAEELAVQQDLLAALNTLPAHYRTALWLVEGEGMSYQEAAEASGFTRNTVATYVMHGRASLKQALDGTRKLKDSES
jgi:RNA polymerase sigma-70 factor (ECF subfamily)